MRKIKGIVVHHSDTETGNVESFKRYHVNILGWKTIGYHYVILKDGTKEVGRSTNKRGAHCRGNNGAVGICLVGKLEHKAPTPEQYKSLIQLLAKECFIHNLDPIGKYKHKGNEVFVISGHKDFCNTDCPGLQFYKLLPQIRTDVSKLLSSMFQIVGK